MHTVEGGEHGGGHTELILETPGKMSPQEYDGMVRDLVAYLEFMAERTRIGVVVILFLGLLVVLTWLLKREYWKDVH